MRKVMSRVRKLGRWSSLHMLWKAREVWVHEVRRMLHVRRVCCKTDECMWALPMLCRLLRLMSVCLCYMSIWQLMRSGLLDGWTCAVLLRAVR